MINAVNEQFSRFVNFAQERVDAGKATAIATKGDVQKGGGTTLEERSISVSRKIDWVSLSIFRGDSAQRANNEVRDLFRKTVADMFGGERNIPDSVRNAMLMKDYGHGKPLTARRILAVRDAIANLDRDNIFSGANDPHGAFADKAFKAGYTRLDFGKLNTAATLFAKARNIPIGTAFDQVITPGSAANRAMNAGSLYMKDVESFGRGYEAHCDIADRDAENMEIASESGSEGRTSNLSRVAENLAYKFRHFADDAKRMLAATNLPANTLDELVKAGNDAADRLDQVFSDLYNGNLTDRKKIAETLFGGENVKNLSPCKLKVVKALADASKSDPAVAEFSKYVSGLVETTIAEYDKLSAAYRTAVSKDMAPTAKFLLDTAAQAGGQATGKPCSIPGGIADSLEGYLGTMPFARFDNIKAFCDNLEKYGDARLRFSDGQKAELKALVENKFGAGRKAEKMFQKLVDGFETAFFAGQIRKPTDYGNAKTTAPERVLRHFKAHPEAIDALENGFKLDSDDDVELLKGDIKNKVREGFRDRLANSSEAADKILTITNLSSGIMPQGVREYNVGYVTFNGAPIPNAQLGTKFPQLGPESNTPQRRGYAEFLESKFDTNHKKMRQFVSYTCGMAEGLGGMIEKLLENGDGKAGLKGRSLSDIIAKGTLLAPTNRHPDENYDIHIAENGDVTITHTHHVMRQFSTLMCDDGAFQPQLLTGNPASPLGGCAKLTVTMTIKNASDAELGDEVPEFTIDDIRQEEI